MSETHHHADTLADDESYFVSMTDMMIGLLFIFIILLMYFALQFKETTRSLTSADETRKVILRDLERILVERNVRVTIDEVNGVLRLPNEILFPKSSDELTMEGKTAVAHLADALEEVLPCYSRRLNAPRPSTCASATHAIEAIFIEGHTDNDRFSSSGKDNWDLSAARATNTYRTLMADKPGLGDFLNGDADSAHGFSVFSVAGYADQRPVDPEESDEAKRQNRRIDLRIVMVAPKAPISVQTMEVAPVLKKSNAVLDE